MIVGRYQNGDLSVEIALHDGDEILDGYERIPRGTPEWNGWQVEAAGRPLPAPPADLPTGNQLFERMTPEEQNEQFGKRKADALRSGRISLTDLVGTSAMITEDDYLTEKPLSEAAN